MFQFENDKFTCPMCSSRLTDDHGQLRCEEHGIFFAYGPQLLVRSPHQNVKLPDAELPWENPRIRHAS